jgi:hypothetical protein
MVEVFYIQKMGNINEKIKLKDLILGLGVFLGTDYIMNDYNNFKFVNKLYNTINYSEESSDEKNKIEKIRKMVIDEVKNSNHFNKYGKDFIIDSLKTATIKISDSDILLDKSNGFFIHLPDIKSNFKMIDMLTKNKKPSMENVIVIQKNLFDDYSYLKAVLVHELYHYIDHLYISIRFNRISNSFNYDEYLDHNIIKNKFDKKYIKNKIKFLFEDEIFGILIDTGIVDELCDSIIKKYNYYSSNIELYSRINTMLYLMNENDLDDLEEYFNFLIDERMDFEDDLILIILLNIDKIEELLDKHK